MNSCESEQSIPAAEASGALTPAQNCAQKDFIISAVSSMNRDNGGVSKQIVCEEVESPSFNQYDGVPPLTWSPGVAVGSGNGVHSQNNVTIHENDNTRLRVIGVVNPDGYQRGLNSVGSTSAIAIGSPAQINSVHNQRYGLVSSDEQMRTHAFQHTSHTQAIGDYTSATFGAQTLSGGENTFGAFRYQQLQNQMNSNNQNRLSAAQRALLQTSNSGLLSSHRNVPLMRLSLHDDQQGVTYEQGDNEGDQNQFHQESDLDDQIVCDPLTLPRFQESCDQIASASGPFNTSANEFDYLQVSRPREIEDEKEALKEDPYWQQQTKLAQNELTGQKEFNQKLFKSSPLVIVLLLLIIDLIGSLLTSSNCHLCTIETNQDSGYYQSMSTASKLISIITIIYKILNEYQERPKLMLIENIGKESHQIVKSTRDILIEVETQTIPMVKPSPIIIQRSEWERENPRIAKQSRSIALSPVPIQYNDAQTSFQLEDYTPKNETSQKQSSSSSSNDSQSVSLSREESLQDKARALEEEDDQNPDITKLRRKSHIRHKTFLEKDIGKFDESNVSVDGSPTRRAQYNKPSTFIKRMLTMKRHSFDQTKFELIKELQQTQRGVNGEKSQNPGTKEGAASSSFMSSETDLLNPQPNTALKEARKTFMSKAHNSQNDSQPVQIDLPLSKYTAIKDESGQQMDNDVVKQGYWVPNTNEDIQPGQTEQQLFNVDTLNNKHVELNLNLPTKYQNVYTGQGFAQKYSHFIPPLLGLDRGRSVYEIAQINSVCLQKLQQDYERKIKHLERKFERFQREAKNAQESLQKKLKNTKIFLNMVIHDMRNPTTSIEFAIKEVLQMILKAKEKTEKTKENLARVTTVQMMPSKNPFSMVRIGTSEIRKVDSESSSDPEDSPDLGKEFMIPLHKESAKFPESQYADPKVKQRMSAGLKKSTPGQSFRGAISEGYLENGEFNHVSSRIVGVEHMMDQPVIFASRGKNVLISRISEGGESDESEEALEDDHSSCSEVGSEGDKNVQVSMVQECDSFLMQQSPLQREHKGARKLLQCPIFPQQTLGMPPNQHLLTLGYHQNESYAVQKQSSKVSFAPGKKSMQRGWSRKVEVRVQSSNDRESVRQEYEVMQQDEVESADYFNNKESSSVEPRVEEKKVTPGHDFYQTFGKSLSKEKVSRKKRPNTEFKGLKPMQIPEDQESNSFAKHHKMNDQLTYASQMIMNHLKNDHSVQHYMEMEGLLKNANFSATMLLNLINDLLDLAKMENQSFNLNASYFNLLDDVITQAVNTLEHLIQQKNIQVKIVNTGGESDQIEHYLRCVHSDRGRFLQIMLNFLSNAIKFTPEHGKITIETIVKETQDIRGKDNEKDGFAAAANQDDRNMIKMMNEFNMKTQKKCLTPRGPKTSNLNGFKQPEEDGQKKYINFEIRIKDSGCGISKENLGKLFLNFGRLEEHQKANERGTGLGLSICKSLLEKMGGNVSVESEGPGMGTTFIIKMQAKCKVQRKHVSPFAVKETKRMLQVKEVVIRQRLNRSYSHFNKPTATIDMGELHDMHIFDTGGLQMMAIMKQGTQKIQLMTDLKISIMGKHEQTPALSNRADNQPKELEPDLEQDMTRPKSRMTSKGLGFMRKMTFLPKKGENEIEMGGDYKSPKGGMNLFTALQSRNTNKSGRHLQLQSQQNLDEVKARYKILVANDDSFQLMILMRVLKQFSDYFEIIDQAENGMVASNLVMNSKKEVPGQVKRPYDLIILDLDMPIMNGYDACRQIRESDHVSNNGLHNLLRMDFKTPEIFEGRVRSISMVEGDNSFMRFKDQPMVVALSAYLNQDIIARCDAAGFDDHLESPLTKDKIMQKLILPLEKRKALKEANQGNESSEGDDKEDSEAMQNQFEGLIEVQGAESHYIQSLPKNGLIPQNSEHTEQQYAVGVVEASGSQQDVFNSKKHDLHTFGGFQVKRRLDEKKRSNRMLGRPQTINEEFEEGKTPC